MGRSLTDAKNIIRAAREAVAGPGRYEGEPAWVAWLDAEWGPADQEWSSDDGGDWAGLWKLDQSDLASPHRLFRELRDPCVTCVTLISTTQGFISGQAYEQPEEAVAHGLDVCFGPVCCECGAKGMGDDYFTISEGGDEFEVCRDCADECETCGAVVLKADGVVVCVDDDTGTLGFICDGCFQDLSCETADERQNFLASELGDIP